MSFLNTLLGAQQVNAADIYDCEDPNSTCEPDPDQVSILNACTTTYGTILDTDQTNIASMCMCKDSSNKTVVCSNLGSDYLTPKLCNATTMGIGYISGMSRSTSSNSCSCPAGVTDTGDNGLRECLRNDYGTLGIECSPAQMRNGTCSRNINKTLGIKESNTNANPTLFVQDIVLTATSFVGTMLVIALLVMGFKYVMGGMDESSTGDLKGNIKKLLIGLGLVIGSYTIIRLIQYVARGY